MCRVCGLNEVNSESKSGRSKASGSVSGKIYIILENIYILQVAITVLKRAIALQREETDWRKGAKKQS